MTGIAFCLAANAALPRAPTYCECLAQSIGSRLTPKGAVSAAITRDPESYDAVKVRIIEKGCAEVASR